MSFTDVLLPDDIRNIKLLKADPLYKKLARDQQESAIKKAKQLGEKASQWLKDNYNGYSISEIIDLFNIQVIYDNTSCSEIVPYSIYRIKNQTIILYVNSIEEAVDELAKQSNFKTYKDLYTNVINIILYHELFHHLEHVKYGSASRLIKATTFNLGIFKFKSGIRALSEIGAHTFTNHCIGSIDKYIKIKTKETP